MPATMPQSNDMRRGAKWMRPKDDRILEALRDEGNLSPFAISREGKVARVDTTPSYASERCRKLLKYGMVEEIDRALYAITDRGRAYLDEELDASTLSPDE